jgi:hypothetical protein
MDKNKLKKLIKEVLSNPTKKDSCNCGCDSCESVGNEGVVLNESLVAKSTLSPNLQYHVDNKLPLLENTFRYGSTAFLNLWSEARKLYSRNMIHVNDADKEILAETNLGEYGIYEGQKVPLDMPMLEENKNINEAEFKGKDVDLNKPERGGSKAYYVYVRDPKTKKTKKVSFGSGGLKAKLNNPKAKKAFAARHNCKDKKDRTTPGYWSCNVGKYWKSLGGDKNFSGYW